MAHIRLHLKQAEGGLPMICMRCGEAATVVVQKKMSSYPRWILFFVLLGGPGIIILGILALLLRKHALLQAPFCDQHQQHWTIRTTIGWMAAIVVAGLGIASVIGLVLLDNRGPGMDAIGPFLCIGGMFALVGLLVLLVVLQNTSIRAEDISGTHILLNGVSDEFVNAVEEAEIERRLRLRQWQYEDDAERMARNHIGNDDDALGERTRPSDAFEEDRGRPMPPTDAFERRNLGDDPGQPPTKST